MTIAAPIERVAFALVSTLAFGCAPSTAAVEPFSGIWAGGDGSYQASLSLSQVGDTVRGGFRLRRPADSLIIVSPSLTVPLHGDSLSFSFAPPVESGYDSVLVRAQRRGDRIDAEVALDSTLIALTLNRQ